MLPGDLSLILIVLSDGGGAEDFEAPLQDENFRQRRRL